MNTESGLFDIAIIGSGPGGYVAAIKGSQLGLRVALIEKYSKFGGTCLHWGCIPTKTLLLSADLYEKALNGKEFGILYKDLSLDFRLVKARKDKLVRKLSMGTDFLMKKNKISTFHGIGRITAPGTVQIDGDQPAEIRTRNIVIATGSEARLLPGLSLEGQTVLTNKEILDLESVPKSLLIIGAGAVGVEFASMFAQFGSAVTVLEMLPRVLPSEDHEISEEIVKILTRKRIKFLTNVRIDDIKYAEGSVEAQISQGDGESRKLVAEKILVAVGRRPVTEGIGLEKLHVALTREFVKVDRNMQTNVPGIFAIGDVVPTPALAHVASHEGILAMRSIAGERPEPINYDLVPSCIYCHPEVARVGLTEAAARERGFDVVTSKFPFAAIGKATILGENEGFVKLVSEKKYKQILGVHMIGPHVTEIITEGTALIGFEATAAELSHIIHPHPTVSEGIMEAAYALYSGAAIHI
ncbi:MAG TPA: dihydrolipoyl dehydrogenase [Acidobacteriota bacterium]|nr:dihydrolipoyl dehydrogenase [Acidobacteriota bacterium]